MRSARDISGEEMGIRASILVGVASSALFYLVQKYFLGWTYPWDIIATAVVLFSAVILAAFLTKNTSSAPKKRTSIMSDIEAKQDLKAKTDGLETKESPEKFLSNLKVDGNAEFDIKDTKI